MKWNRKSLLLAVWWVALLFIGDIEGKEASSQKKYNLSVCAIFTNEAKFIKEWIEYHRLIGVDHFYLYDNKSQDREALKKVLQPFIKDRIVTFIEWPYALDSYGEAEAFKWSLSTQVTAFEHAIKLRAERETQWMVILGVDEFLVPVNASKVTGLLERFDECAGIALLSNHFDACGLGVLPKRRLLVETVERMQCPPQNLQTKVSKMIFKPSQCSGFTWPPYAPKFKENQKVATIEKQELRINQYVNRYTGFLRYKGNKGLLHLDHHEAVSEDKISALLQAGYEVEDNEKAIYRFIPDLLKKMN